MIDTSNWKEFRVGELFSCETTLGIPSKNDLEDGNINYITRSAIDNGFSGTCGNEDHKNKGNCITIGAEGFVAFWQSDDFVAGNKVYALRHPNMNEINGLFVCSALNALSDRYSFADARVLDKIKVEIIKLPVTSDGQPDWDYMESYMKAVMEESEKSLESLRKADNTKHLIDVSGWGEFRVGDLFDKLTLKCLKKDFNKAIDCSEEQTDEFSLPLTNAKHFNNGIQFYGRPDDWESAEMTIDIVSNGAIATGDVYAQPQRTGVLWDSYLVKCKYNITSELVLQYMSCVIQRCIKQYFGWDDKCTWNKVKEQMIRLPITSTGEPDWQYMEDYMRIIMDKSEHIISDLQIGA